MKIAKRLAIYARVILSLLGTFGGVKCQVLTPEQTVQRIADGKSLIRFGDGEFGIYRGKDIHYQKWSPALKAAFDQIKQDWQGQGGDCPYLLAVPHKFMAAPGWVLMKKRVYVSSWAESRWQFQKTFDRRLTYGDAFLFEKANREIYGRLWSGEQAMPHVVFVHRQEEYARQFAQTYKKETRFVCCPARDAFSTVDALEQEILAVIKENGWTAGDTCVTVSAGPAGKVLVYRLSKKGYQGIDAGHCWDDPLEGMEYGKA